MRNRPAEVPHAHTSPARRAHRQNRKPKPTPSTSSRRCRGPPPAAGGRKKRGKVWLLGDMGDAAALGGS